MFRDKSDVFHIIMMEIDHRVMLYVTQTCGTLIANGSIWVPIKLAVIIAQQRVSNAIVVVIIRN